MNDRIAKLTAAFIRGKGLVATLREEGMNEVEVVTLLVSGLVAAHVEMGVSEERIMEQVAIAKEAERRSGLPTVIIEGDMVDSRLFNEAEAESRIESFMEVVTPSVTRWRSSSSQNFQGPKSLPRIEREFRYPTSI